MDTVLSSHRDPIWHLQNPTAAICNANGFLSSNPINLLVKAFVQPIQSTRATRLSKETTVQLFGEIQADDHLGIFPIEWAGITLNLRSWGRATEDWIGYDGQKFTVINANKFADPSNGNPNHHWEAGLRLID